jgi:hypothetical protein
VDPLTDRLMAGLAGGCRKVPRMPEERQDPANTQMFRAFVERGEQETDRRGMGTAYVLVAAAVVIVIVALVVIFAT